MASLGAEKTGVNENVQHMPVIRLHRALAHFTFCYVFAVEQIP